MRQPRREEQWDTTLVLPRLIEPQTKTQLYPNHLTPTSTLTTATPYLTARESSNLTRADTSSRQDPPDTPPQ